MICKVQTQPDKWISQKTHFQHLDQTVEWHIKGFCLSKKSMRDTQVLKSLHNNNDMRITLINISRTKHREGKRKTCHFKKHMTMEHSIGIKEGYSDIELSLDETLNLTSLQSEREGGGR